MKGEIKMAKTTTKEKQYNKKYYQKHKKEIIDDVQDRQKSNRPKYNKEKREYYADNEDYRKYKRRYAKKYRKEEPIKSKARKDRKALKEK